MFFKMNSFSLIKMELKVFFRNRGYKFFFFLIKNSLQTKLCLFK